MSLPLPKIREIFVYSYRLIYEIFPNRIEALALIHSKRDFLAIRDGKPVATTEEIVIKIEVK